MRLHLPTGGLLLAWCVVAAAAEPDGAHDGFALNRFAIADRGSDWFVLESLDFRGDMRAAMGVGLEWAEKPLIVDDDEVNGQVDGQLVSHIGLSFLLRQRVRLALDLPAVLHQSGKAGAMMFVPPDSSSVGDLRLGVDVRLLGSYRGRASLAAGVQVELPTGDQTSFAGDGEARLSLRLLAAGELGRWVWAAKAGYLHRGQDAPVGAAPYGSELFAGLAVGARVGLALVGVELYGSSVSGSFLESHATAVELLLGAHLRVARDWRAGVGLGPGLTDAPGTPSFRLVAAMEWAPEPAGAGRGVPRGAIAERTIVEPPLVPEPPPVLPPAPPISPAPPAPADTSPARLEGDRIALREPLTWKRDRLASSAEPLLRGIAKVMEGHPEITHVNVLGKPARARAVVRWLTSHGVAAQRLSAVARPGDAVELVADELVRP